MTPTTTRELAEALRDAREFIGEAIQCRGNVDLCNCNDHLLLRRLDDAQQSQSGEREAVPDSRDWRLAISEAIAGFSPSSLTPTIWERIERRARELAGQGREAVECAKISQG